MLEKERVLPLSVSRLRSLLESRQLIQNPIAVFSKHLSERADTYYYALGGVKKVLVSIDPKILNHILKENCENYHKSDIQTRRIHHFLGAGLLSSHGDQWVRQRKIIQQGFGGDKLANMAAAMRSCLEESLTHFDEDIRRGPVDVRTQLMAMTFKMATCSLFSARLSDDDMRLISHAISQVQAFMVRQIVQPFLSPWFAFSGELRRHELMRAEADKIMLDHIRQRRTERDRTDDLLQILLDARYNDTGEGMTDEKILSECMHLLVAGHEATSNALSWTLYLLSRHPDYLRRARKELKAVVGKHCFEFSHSANLPLTRQIIDESLRLYPPFWMVDRVALEDDRVGDLPIPKGTVIIAFIYGAHRAPAYWSDPHDFLPERCNGDERLRLRFHYLPFGGGPRVCIGRYYAMLQMLMILNALLRRYDFKLTTDEAIELHPMFILRPRNGISMRFKRLKAET